MKNSEIRSIKDAFRLLRPSVFFLLLLFVLSFSMATPQSSFLDHVELTLNGTYGNSSFHDYVIVLRKYRFHELLGELQGISFYYPRGQNSATTGIQVNIADGFLATDRFDFYNVSRTQPQVFPALSASSFRADASSLTVAMRTGVAGPARQVSGTVSLSPPPPVQE